MAPFTVLQAVPLVLLVLAYGVVTFGQRDYIDNSSPLVKAFATRVFAEGEEIEQSNGIEAAMGYFHNAFEIAPSAESAYFLASAYEKQLNAEGAMFWLQKGLEMDPFNITTLNKIGLIFHFSTNYAAALAHFTRALDHHRTHSVVAHAAIAAPSVEQAVEIATERALVSESWYNAGVSYAHSGSIELAAEAYYQASYFANPTGSTDYFPKENTPNAATHIVISPNFRALLNLAALHHGHGSLVDGVAAYRDVLAQMHRYNDDLSRYRASHSGQRDERVTGAVEVNWHMLSMTRSNLGAALIQNDQIAEAEQELLSLYAFVHDINVHTCTAFPANTLPPAQETMRLRECANIGRGESHVSSLILNARKRYCNWDKWEVGWMDLLTDSRRGWWPNDDIPRSAVDSSSELPTLTPFDSLLLPYINAGDRLALAVKTSETITANVIQPHRHWGRFVALKQATQRAVLDGVAPPKARINIGFLSYDFNSHPTAHLVEAIFVEISRCKEDVRRATSSCLFPDNGPSRRVFEDVNLYIYSYGKDDNSTYRRNLERLAFKFVDLATVNFEDSASMINQDGIDILLEMQLHTLGHRLQITAHTPAPVQVSYLVYPGTAGAASFLSHIIADATVVPVDSQSQFYSEKMLLLPETYQVSFDGKVDVAGSTSAEPCSVAVHPAGTDSSVAVYARLAEERRALRLRFGLPTDDSAIVIMNFNKIDKLDPISFQIWMQVLQRLPTAVLWLLCPEDGRKRRVFNPEGPGQQSESNEYIEPQQNMLTKDILHKMARMHGISASRVVFGNRTDKASHIRRHVAADLFIDTFTYGAHSTATDALRGGLPVLTVEGTYFPSRVGASLYSSLLDGGSDTERDMQQLNDLMVLPSLKDAEEMSIRLLRLRGGRRGQHHTSAAAAGAGGSPAVAPLTRTLLAKLSAVTTLPSNCEASTSSRPVGFFDSAAAVSKLVYGLESLVESEAFVSPRNRFLSKSEVAAGDTRSSHGHVVLCKQNDI